MYSTLRSMGAHRERVLGHDEAVWKLEFGSFESRKARILILDSRSL